MKMINKFAQYCRLVKAEWNYYSKYKKEMSVESKRVLEEVDVKKEIESLQKSLYGVASSMTASITLGSLNRLGREGKTVDELYLWIKTFEEVMVNVFPLRADNAGSVVIEGRSGKKYMISAHQYSSSYSFHLWDENGIHALGECESKTNDPLAELVNWLEEIIKLDERGAVNCSGCKHPIGKHEIAGTYFAGMYCKKCWESKYRQLEANENYN